MCFIHYGNTDCGIFKWGVKNLKHFCLRINIFKGNYWILRIGLMGRCQKLGIILESKVIEKLMLSKNVNNKNCAPKLIFFNEKKIEKYSDRFWHKNLTLKVRFWSNFGTFDTSSLNQFSKFKNFLSVCWFLCKNISNFVPPVWKLHNPYCHTMQRTSGN